ncbi:small G protein signaling modulator 2-like isoform X2 [Neocloeon triangulifer]|uniref:small G protein signaling modulator 2-like isoform X2 n=1 Tax=Neocloeon triangulifer TaxID=2078957 RepID=UPI00286F3E96|nr:small G protein signaling modulator 2-like isoform X2 [Neocloeon triangulifer]
MSFISTDAAPDTYKDKLIKNVKKEVKQIMEEAVTRKFVHEDSSSITSLCAAVETCLSQGLRRRALGLFKTSSTTALLHKVGKSFPPAATISQMVQDVENSEPNRRSSSSGDSTNRLIKPQLIKKNSASGVLSNSCNSLSTSGNANAPATPRYLWLRLALFEKQLAKIIDHLVQNSSKYYEKDALVSDPDYGSILSSLLVGPCALDYSRTKTQDHFWTDPPADELVQRHRISGHNSSTPPVTRRPALNFRRSLHGVTTTEESMPRPLTSSCAKEYVESLHQNSRATLLYGKNNVLVLPKDLTEPIPGYLSLHQSPNALTIKWTPNQLMNGYNEAPQDTANKSLYWDYALHVNVDDIVYVHCHQQADSGGTVVLVGLDGVQRPPIHFPRGGHLLAFLSCLETGLLPHGQLDPPLWSQRGKGKVFPRLRRKARAVLEKPGIFSSSSSINSCSSIEEEEASDYVFRIISKAANHEDISEWFFPRSPVPPSPGTRSSLFSTSTASSTSSSKSISLDGGPPEPSPPPVPKAFKISPGDSIQLLCDTMKRQIISRAFYGWLAYCRHLTTVRTHLSGLVHSAIISAQSPTDASAGLTEEKWLEMTSNGNLPDEAEVFRLTYYGGVAPSIRKQVWPYLLGHIPFASTEEEKKEQDLSVRRAYETTMSEWLAVEAIVRQRDKEVMAANLAKLSSESTSNAGDAPPQVNHDLANDVFEESESSDSEPEEAPAEGGPRQGRRPTVCPPNSLEAPDVDHSNQQAPEPGKLLQGINRAQPQPQASEERSSSPDEGVGEELEDGAPSEPEHKEPKKVETEPVLVTTTNPSVDSGNQSEVVEEPSTVNGNAQGLTLEQLDGGVSPGSRSGAVSPASSQGGVYSTELLENYGLNLHRIEKDVQRCDRNYWYFATEGNLDKLRNVMCTYVWEHLDIGYMQGMCDLVAPLLVIMDDEALSYACFCRLMDRMVANFPNGGAMDTHFANMRSLIQILDSEMFELMHQHGDYTHFYFCYRWFLLDFKRELLYDDVFVTWETIWASKHVASQQFGLFLALALVETYRDIILSNAMDFTDIIKFFNEMAERHDAKAVLNLARDLVLQLQTLIDNK